MNTKKLYSVYYTRPDYFGNFIGGEVLPTRARLHDTHAYVKMCDAEDLEDVFVQMQGELGDTAQLVELVAAKGLGHTSMSVGDVVSDGTRFWAVAPMGFTELQ
jgi:hypothetical protein